MKWIAKLMIAASLLAAAGCHGAWCHKRHNDQAQFQRDRADCEQIGRNQALSQGYPVGSVGYNVALAMRFHSCMTERDYYECDPQQASASQTTANATQASAQPAPQPSVQAAPQPSAQPATPNQGQPARPDPELAAALAQPDNGACLGIDIAVGNKGKRYAVRIDRVVPDGPADKAGLRPGDIIVSAGGSYFRDKFHFIKFIKQHKPGDTVTFGFIPAGTNHEKQRQVTLGDKKEVAQKAQPKASAAAPSPAPRTKANDEGIVFPTKK
jgi:predicted metalloprotease with PDZ domain